MSELLDLQGRPLASSRSVRPTRLSVPEGKDRSEETKPLESRDTCPAHVLRNGMRVTRDYFCETRDRWTYPGAGGLIVLERIEPGCYAIIQDTVVVDVTPSRLEGEQLIAEFHRSVAAEQRAEQRAEAEALEERRRHYQQFRERYPR